MQSIGFGIMGPATSLATDIQGGIVDRLRTLPISRASYLIGHLIAELMAMALMIAILCGTGLVVGWRITSDVPHAIAGFALLLLFATTMLWVGTLLGIIVRSPDAAQGVVFMTVFPLTFLATTFVPADGLDGVVGEIAAWNPFSAFSAAIRDAVRQPDGDAGRPRVAARASRRREPHLVRRHPRDRRAAGAGAVQGADDGLRSISASTEVRYRPSRSA